MTTIQNDGGGGRLERAGGRWRLRFTRELAHPPERVWSAITEPEHLDTWFPQRVRGEWLVGAALTFSGDGYELGGEVLSYEPPRLLEFRWGADVIRLELAPREGGCTLTLLDTIDELGKAARDGAGWHECLDLLECHLDGGEPWPTGARWARLHPGYVTSFGPEASTIGPPPEFRPLADVSGADGGTPRS
jgi:uncharacterized protein YndB with AHSA1/START domain